MLKQGDEKSDVQAWKEFVAGQVRVSLDDSPLFDAGTHRATVAFQMQNGIVPPDGRVNAATVKAATGLGFSGF